MGLGKKIIYAGAAAGALALWYYNAAQALLISIINPSTGLPNIQYESADASGIKLNLRFAITNPSLLPFLAPRFNMVITDSNGTQIGTAQTTVIQSIPGRTTSFVNVDATIPYESTAIDLYNAISTAEQGNLALPTGIDYSGTINLWFGSIPIQGSLT